MIEGLAPSNVEIIGTLVIAIVIAAILIWGIGKR